MSFQPSTIGSKAMHPLEAVLAAITQSPHERIASRLARILGSIDAVHAHAAAAYVAVDAHIAAALVAADGDAERIAAAQAESDVLRSEIDQTAALIRHHLETEAAFLDSAHEGAFAAAAEAVKRAVASSSQNGGTSADLTAAIAALEAVLPALSPGDPATQSTFSVVPTRQSAGSGGCSVGYRLVAPPALEPARLELQALGARRGLSAESTRSWRLTPSGDMPGWRDEEWGTALAHLSRRTVASAELWQAAVPGAPVSQSLDTVVGVDPTLRCVRITVALPRSIPAAAALETDGTGSAASAAAHAEVRTQRRRWDDRINDDVAGAPSAVFLTVVVQNIVTLIASGSPLAAIPALPTALRNVPYLTSLSLSDMRVSEGGHLHRLPAALRHAPLLKSLLLLDCALHGAGGAAAVAASLPHVPFLTTLNLTGNALGDEEVVKIAAALRCVPQLAVLNLQKNRMGDAGACAIAVAVEDHLQQLEMLDATSNRIGNAGAIALAQALQRTPSLVSLRLRGNAIGAEGAHALAQAAGGHARLSVLALGDNNLFVAGITFIAESLLAMPPQALKVLDVGSGRLNSTGAQLLASALCALPHLLELNVTENDIGDEGFAALADAMGRHTPRLTHFAARSTYCRDAGMRALAAVLYCLPELSILVLGRNRFGVDGACALAAALPGVPLLSELDVELDVLSSAQAPTTGQRDAAVELASALRHLSLLRVLRMGSTGLGDTAACVLATSLMHTPSLEVLALQWNRFGAAGARALAGAFPSLPRLQQLTLECNRTMGPEGGCTLIAALRQTPLLATVNMSDCGIGVDGARELLTVLPALPVLTDALFGGNSFREDDALAERLEAAVLLHVPGARLVL